MKRNPKEDFPALFVIIMVIFMFVIPIVLGAYTISADTLGFWGSYLGGIIGMIAVVLTTHYLIRNQNKHHKEQMIQQRIEISKSISGSAQLEREKFMIQFNIEKYENALLILKKLESKIDSHVQSYNETIHFVLRYFDFVLTNEIISREEYERYSNVVEEFDREIVFLLAELRNLEKVIEPFEFDNIEIETFQYLNSVRRKLILLNSNAREEAMGHDTSSLNNCRLNIVNSRNVIYDHMKKELENYNKSMINVNEDNFL